MVKLIALNLYYQELENKNIDIIRIKFMYHYEMVRSLVFYLLPLDYKK